MSYQYERGYYWGKLVGDREWRILSYADQYDWFYIVGQSEHIPNEAIVTIVPIKLEPPEVLC